MEHSTAGDGAASTGRLYQSVPVAKIIVLGRLSVMLLVQYTVNPERLLPHSEGEVQRSKI